MNERKKPSIAFWAAVAGVPLALYLGAYLLLVQPTLRAFLVSPGSAVDFSVVPAYRWPGRDDAWESNFCTTVFGPLIFLDRTLLPARWTPDPRDIP